MGTMAMTVHIRLSTVLCIDLASVWEVSLVVLPGCQAGSGVGAGVGGAGEISGIRSTLMVENAAWSVR